MIELLDSHLYRSKISDELRHLIMYIARAGKYIHYYIKTGDLGLAGTDNVQGEKQKALDVVANTLIMKNLAHSHLVCIAASEEEEFEREFIDTRHQFSVAFDPLDGSSLIETNHAVGSIFTIYEGKGLIGRKGRDQQAAIIIVYGPRTTLTYTTGKGVHEFTLNDVGEFCLSHENITIAPDAKHFAPGNMRAAAENEKYRKLIDHWIDEKYTLRYSGGMVPDMNHMFKKGEGIFTYPANPPRYPNGKLRLLYECNPFSYLVEQAGGKASNGETGILDIEIRELHQRSTIYIGSKNEVAKAIRTIH
jgi:fructose-1,6-bisphosphatase I